MVKKQQSVVSEIGYDGRNRAEELLCAENLVKYYGSLKVLSSISLTIYKGETLAIMGPSGSGKSTLLHVLAGILPADSGRIILKKETEVEVTALQSDALSRMRLEDLGFVFQQGMLLPELTVLENVALPYMMLTNDISEAKKKARDLLAKMDL